MLKGIEAVIFDLDGTLIDSMGVWNGVDSRFLGKRGIPVPPTLMEDLGTRSYREAAQYFIARFNLDEDPEDIQKV